MSGQRSQTPEQLGTMSAATLAALGLLLAGIVGGGVYLWQQRIIDDRDARLHSLQGQTSSDQVPASAITAFTSDHGVKLIVYTPIQHSQVHSPLVVLGQVPGTWSFEASFPITLEDKTGTVIAHGQGHLLSDWTTTRQVPFSAVLEYTSASPGAGSLILHKDNPSGLAARNDQLRLAVTIE